jgi:hypothetical protein
MAKAVRSIKVTFKPAAGGKTSVEINVTPEIREEVKTAIISDDDVLLAKIPNTELTQARVLLELATILDEHMNRKETL